MSDLTPTFTTIGSYSTWAVNDGIRATSLAIVRTNAEEVARAVAVVPSVAGFSAGDAMLMSVCTHEQVAHVELGEVCAYLGRCESDAYVSSVAHPLFQAAAAAGFADTAVYALLTDLHTSVGA